MSLATYRQLLQHLAETCISTFQLYLGFSLNSERGCCYQIIADSYRFCCQFILFLKNSWMSFELHFFPTLSKEYERGSPTLDFRSRFSKFMRNSIRAITFMCIPADLESCALHSAVYRMVLSRFNELLSLFWVFPVYSWLKIDLTCRRWLNECLRCLHVMFNFLVWVTNFHSQILLELAVEFWRPVCWRNITTYFLLDSRISISGFRLTGVLPLPHLTSVGHRTMSTRSIHINLGFRKPVTIERFFTVNMCRDTRLIFIANSRIRWAFNLALPTIWFIHPLYSWNEYTFLFSLTWMGPKTCLWRKASINFVIFLLLIFKSIG